MFLNLVLEMLAINLPSGLNQIKIFMEGASVIFIVNGEF